MSDKLTIERDELFGDDIDRALATRRAALGSSAPPPPPISKFRRVLYSNLFYFPAAAFLGALLSWLILEPDLQDMPVVAGQVDLVNEEPFNAEGYTSFTIASPTGEGLTTPLSFSRWRRCTLRDYFRIS